MSKLPIVNSPTLVCELPLSKTTVKYRPFVIKEQKALLLAQQSEDSNTILATIKDVMHSCTGGTLDFAKIPTGDLGYFFIQLRIASVGPEVKFTTKCDHCGEEVVIGMSLEDVKVKDTAKTDVKITSNVGITFRLPNIDDSLTVKDGDTIKDIFITISVA